ncbi:MAG: DUF4123 domain-containing protein [Gemmatimonadetes bacterium]|nr:DUF4123 domain-containing protein [Gemmatimonadota bacterium]
MATATPVTAERLRRLADDGVLFAVVDACDRGDVPPRAWERGAPSLYAGTEDAALWAIAPYLFAVDGDLLDWIGERRNDAWGVFAVADCGLDALATHLRGLLVVRSPEGERWRFRFYDPRVLPAFLESCDDETRRGFFGPASAFGVWMAEEARLFHATGIRLVER